MKTIITILITILCLASVFAQKKQNNDDDPKLKKRYKTNNGIFIYNGEYIKPPYVIKVKDFAVYINGYEMYKKSLDPYEKYIVKKDPGYPKGVNKFTTYNELFALKTIDNKFITSTKEKYYYSTYPTQQAKDSIIAFYRSLLNIESFETTSFKTTYSLKTYADIHSILIDIAPNGYKEPYLAKPTKRKKLLKSPKEAVFFLYDDLEKGKCIFAGNDSVNGLSQYTTDVNSIYFQKFINFLSKDTLSENEKKYLYDSLRFRYRPYCKKFKITNELEQRIQQIISDKNNNTELNSNILKSKSFSSLDDTNNNKRLQSSLSGYSPHSKSVRSLFVVPHLSTWGWNPISKEGEVGLFFRNTNKNAGQSGLVIAPHDDAMKGIRIDANGNVGIGLNNPNYALEVKGTIKGCEVLVQPETWCDYVFDDDYKLTSLIELENYIKKFKHLPEVPTTSDVVQNGIKMGEMNAILLKKIEELTLHVILLNKEIENLKQSTIIN